MSCTEREHTQWGSARLAIDAVRRYKGVIMIREQTLIPDHLRAKLLVAVLCTNSSELSPLERWRTRSSGLIGALMRSR